MQSRSSGGYTALALIALSTSGAFAQAPVDEAGQSYAYQGADIEELGEAAAPRLSAAELEELVGPVALYPDALLAVVLPAAAYPLQIVQAARFLDALEEDPTLTPPEDWDESVVALLNYPEVLRQLNDDIDWTLALGEAVIVQQADVLSAIQRFRDRVHAAGHLNSDSRREVVYEDDIIEIRPVDERVLYVPVYEPATVVQRSVRPVYTYHVNPYPVYYYPYSDGYSFHRGFFWGVTSAYALGWSHHRHRLHVVHHSFYGHPYYGRHYGYRWWYRRPTLTYHNHYYFRDSYRPTYSRHRRGDYWIPRYTHRDRIDRRHAARSRGHLDSGRVRSSFTRSYRPDSDAASGSQRYSRSTGSLSRNHARHRSDRTPGNNVRRSYTGQDRNTDRNTVTTPRYRTDTPTVAPRTPVTRPSTRRNRSAEHRVDTRIQRRATTQSQPPRQPSYQRREPTRQYSTPPKPRSQAPARTSRQSPPSRNRDAGARQSRSSSHSGGRNRSSQSGRRHDDR